MVGHQEVGTGGELFLALDVDTEDKSEEQPQKRSGGPKAQRCLHSGALGPLECERELLGLVKGMGADTPFPQVPGKVAGKAVHRIHLIGTGAAHDLD